MVIRVGFDVAPYADPFGYYRVAFYRPTHHPAHALHHRTRTGPVLWGRDDLCPYLNVLKRKFASGVASLRTMTIRRQCNFSSAPGTFLSLHSIHSFQKAIMQGTNTKYETTIRDTF